MVAQTEPRGESKARNFVKTTSTATLAVVSLLLVVAILAVGTVLWVVWRDDSIGLTDEGVGACEKQYGPGYVYELGQCVKR